MPRTRCKVDDAIETYGVTAPGSTDASVDEYLARRWTGTHGSQATGYRPLAEWFNQRLLAQQYERVGRSTIGTRVQSDYAALTGENEVVREEVVRDLDADGIDAEAVVDAMVSPRTLHRHLRECLGIEKEREPAETDWERESVQRAQDQLERKVAKAVGSLATKGALVGGDAAGIDIDIYLSCPECTTRVPFEVGRHQGYVCQDHLAQPETSTPVDARSGEVSVGEALRAFVT